MATLAHNVDEKREFLRHTLATIAYRGGKAIRGAPAEFADFRAAETTRTPGQTLAHIRLALATLKQTSLSVF